MLPWVISRVMFGSASYITTSSSATLENGQIRAPVVLLGSRTDKKLPVDTGDTDKISKDSVPFVSEPFSSEAQEEHLDNFLT